MFPRILQAVTLAVLAVGVLAALTELIVSAPAEVHEGVPWVAGVFSGLMIFVLAVERMTEFSLGKEGLSGKFDSSLADARAASAAIAAQPADEEEENDDHVQAARKKLIALLDEDKELALIELKNALGAQLRAYAKLLPELTFPGDLDVADPIEVLNYLEKKNAIEAADARAIRTVVRLVEQDVSKTQARELITFGAEIQLSTPSGSEDVYRVVHNRLGESIEIYQQRLIFSTSRQKTWLVFTSEGLACVLDNRAKGGQISVKWVIPISELSSVTVSTSDSKQGKRLALLHIGSRRNWLVTRALFTSMADLEQMIQNDIQETAQHNR